MDKVLAALYLLGICCSLGLGNEKNFSLEDEDGSTDDEDFSGSGLGVIVPSALDEVGKEYSEPKVPLVPTVVQEFTENVTAIMLAEPTTKQVKMTTSQTEDDVEKINEPGLFDEIPAVGPSSHADTTHEPTSTAVGTTEKSDIFDADHHPHHHGHHHHHHHHHKTTTNPPVPEEDTTQGQPIHKHHEHHIPNAEVTTSSPKEHLPFHKTTSPGPAEDTDFVYHHNAHHPEAPSGSSSTPYADNEESTAEPSDADGHVLVGFEIKPTTEPSDNLHNLHKQTTASSLVDGSNVHHVLHGKITTSPPHNVEPSKEDERTAATNPPEDAESEVLVHHDDKTTSPSSHVESEDHVHNVNQATTPSDVDKHHHHHHHHHPHTTTASTEQTTDSDEQHGLHTLKPTDHFVVATTRANVVPVVNEDLNVPEDADSIGGLKPTTEESPVEKSTHPQMPDETDVDLFDSKEDEVSGDGTEMNNDLFFEKTLSDVKSEVINRSSGDGEGSLDASHGIMERKELLAGIIAGGAVGLIFAGFLVGFVFYRMKKKDEGSYSLEEPKQSNGGYQKPREQREFYA
ncbi:syndecan-1 [Spea bombifrons]|uniref:syndecan-1 n=1 Tax=Spea bombifrons TaxID=233779 RepID=UPI0023490245|nr:syndecan-1 [Spea bombifrons]